MISRKPFFTRSLLTLFIVIFAIPAFAANEVRTIPFTKSSRALIAKSQSNIVIRLQPHMGFNPKPFVLHEIIVDGATESEQRVFDKIL